MMPLLIRKEWLALARDGRIVVLTLAVVALFAAVFAVAHGDLRKAQQEKHYAETAARAQWDTQGGKHPHRGAHFGLYVFAPASPLASFDPGVGRHLGQTLWLEPHKRNMLRFSEAADDPASSRFGEFTPAFVLTVIYPLLLVAVVFSAVTQERESGTLRMLRGLTMHEQRFMWGKFLAILAASAAMVVLAFSVVLISAMWQPDGTDTLLRSMLLCLAFLIYASVFIALGLSVSALCRSSRQALVILAAIWIAFAFIVPRGAAAIAAQTVALPTTEQFWSAIRRDYEQGLPGDGDLATRSKRFDDALMRKYRVQRLEDLPVGAYAIRRLHRDAYADKVHSIHFNDLWERLAQQEADLRRTALLSPAMAMQLLSMKLSGTDLAHRRHFEEAAETYRRYVNTHIDTWDVANSTGLRSFDDKYGNDDLWQSIARFTYRPPSASAALYSALPELGILSGWVLLALVLLAGSARRLRI